MDIKQSWWSWQIAIRQSDLNRWDWFGPFCHDYPEACAFMSNLQKLLNLARCHGALLCRILQLESSFALVQMCVSCLIMQQSVSLCFSHYCSLLHASFLCFFPDIHNVFQWYITYRAGKIGETEGPNVAVSNMYGWIQGPKNIALPSHCVSELFTGLCTCFLILWKVVQVLTKKKKAISVTLVFV